MKKFRFPLTSVATLRALREQRTREGFAAAVQSCAIAEDKLRRAHERVVDLETALLHDRSGCFRAAEQVSFMQSLLREKVREADAIAELTRTQVERERCRLVWMEARRDLRLVGLLEEKARVLHRHECQHEEQMLMDDRTNALAAREA